MQCSLGISNFLEEISSLSHSVAFLYFFTLITEEGFLISTGSLKKWDLDFPGGSVVENLPANAGDTGLIPDARTKILHITEQLSTCTTTTEACMHRVHALQQEKPPQWEACTPQLESALLTAIRESPRAAVKTQGSQKLKNKDKIPRPSHGTLGLSFPFPLLPNNYRLIYCSFLYPVHHEWLSKKL